MAPRISPILTHDFGQIVQTVYTPPGGWPVVAKHLDSTAEGRSGNTSTEFLYGTDGRDVVYGNGGSDYISTGNGDDKLVAGSNNSVWQGSGNEVAMGATTLDGGAGADDFILNGSTGAFKIVTGEGQDDVSVTGLTHVTDYVFINAQDSDGAVDTFTFGANFNGHADISGIDSFDSVTFKGGDWGYNQHTDRYENSTGGSVTLQGVTHNYNDPDIFFL